MTLEIDSQYSDGILRVHCHGIYDLDSALRAFSDSFDIADKAGAVVIFIDCREITDTPSSLERFEIGSHIADLSIGSGNSLQWVVVGAEPIVEPQRFVELVATNRGLRINVFTDIEEAEAWLSRIDLE